MRENRKYSIEDILQVEGGYVDHPRDPGGCTKFGITIGTLRAWRKSKNISGVNCQDVKNLDTAEATKIYTADYWNKVAGDELPAGLDLLVFDMGVNAGPGRAAKMLQGIVGTDQDGAIGPITLKAVGHLVMSVGEEGMERLIHQYSAVRRTFYRSLPTFSTFGKGWLNRVGRMEKNAIKLAQRASPGTEEDKPEEPVEPEGLTQEEMDRNHLLKGLRDDVKFLAGQLQELSDKLKEMEQ